MKNRLAGSVIVWLLLSLCAFASSGNAVTPHATPKNKSASSDLPLRIFQQIDQRLSRLDADNQSLRRKRLEEDPGHSKSARTKILRSLQRSPEFRERTRTVNQLLAISAHAERNCESRRKRYGARLFRDLHARFVEMKAPITRSASAQTLTAFERDEKLVEKHMLPAVVQFQAISGGYVALACRPGSRACCESRRVGQGRLVVRGCTWSCTSKLTASTNVFLGPLVPKSVIAVKNSVPEGQNHGSKPTIAARSSHKQKSVERATASANRQSAPAGSE